MIATALNLTIINFIILSIKVKIIPIPLVGHCRELHSKQVPPTLLQAAKCSRLSLFSALHITHVLSDFISIYLIYVCKGGSRRPMRYCEGRAVLSRAFFVFIQVIDGLGLLEVIYFEKQFFEEIKSIFVMNYLACTFLFLNISRKKKNLTPKSIAQNNYSILAMSSHLTQGWNYCTI